MNLDLVIAIFLGLSGFALGIRQIALSPDNETFPKAPLFVRGTMFVGAAVMAFASALFWGAAATPGDYAGQGAWAVAIILGVVAFYNVVMIVNICAQRYRPEVWQRLHRANDIVKRSCPSLRPQLSLRRQ